MFARLKRALLLSVAPWLAYLLLRLLWLTYRVKIDRPSAERLAALEAPSPDGKPEATIFAYWHDQIFASSPFLVKHLIRSGRKISLMISPSDDGELVARTIKRLGLTVVRGSASRDGAKALRALYRHVMKQDSSPVMLPDGPKGPAFEAKSGTVVLAQMTQKRITPLAFAVDRAWTLRSWDAMRMPKPFAIIRVYCGEPFLVPRRLSSEQVEDQTGLLRTRLDALRAHAQAQSP